MIKMIPPPPPEITAKSGGGVIDKLWKERPTKAKMGLFTGGFIAFSLVLSACGSDAANEASPASTVTEAPSSETAASAGSETAPTVPASTEPQVRLTPSEQQAVRSAEDYLSFMAFSRQGLIDQLSSEYGEGFTVEDATVAVDSLSVDWNSQAAKSAEEYLDLQGFSCQGLIDQLSSEYGEKFTMEQATYGATQTGIC